MLRSVRGCVLHGCNMVPMARRVKGSGEIVAAPVTRGPLPMAAVLPFAVRANRAVVASGDGDYRAS
jgi:hypothetical protein